MVVDLNLDKLYYTEGNSVLNNFSLRIDEGEIITILGKSGCGKSTLLKTVAGLHKGYEGSVNIKENANIGYIPQNKCLLPWKSAYQNVVLLKKIKKMPIVEKEALDLLERLAILHLKDKYVNKLSGGEYQRVVLGQVFFYRPNIILMDEPFSALDADTKNEVMTLFLELQKEKNIAALFVTHSEQEANFMNGRVIRLSTTLT